MWMLPWVTTRRPKLLRSQPFGAGECESRRDGPPKRAARCAKTGTQIGVVARRSHPTSEPLRVVTITARGQVGCVNGFGSLLSPDGGDGPHVGLVGMPINKIICRHHSDGSRCAPVLHWSASAGRVLRERGIHSQKSS